MFSFIKVERCKPAARNCKRARIHSIPKKNLKIFFIFSWFPPVSFTIGVWEPQKYIWMFVLFFHITPRVAFLMVSEIYRMIIKPLSYLYINNGFYKLYSWANNLFDLILFQLFRRLFFRYTPKYGDRLLAKMFTKTLWIEPFGLLLLSILDTNTHFCRLNCTVSAFLKSQFIWLLIDNLSAIRLILCLMACGLLHNRL